jgi:hypothetical protein
MTDRQSNQENASEKAVQDIVNQMGEIKIVTADLKSKLYTIFDKLKTPVNVDNPNPKADSVHLNDGSISAEDVVVSERETSEISIDDAIHDMSDDLN